MIGDLCYFANQRGGYDAQKWPLDVVGTIRRPIRRHRLTAEEYELSIDELVEKYPPPPPRESKSNPIIISRATGEAT